MINPRGKRRGRRGLQLWTQTKAEVGSEPWSLQLSCLGRTLRNAQADLIQIEYGFRCRRHYRLPEVLGVHKPRSLASGG